ncbi:D-alanine--D-alanine ligase family protein [Planctomicrobium sp. SH664]|uniref:D-alanine--D-alanine ligase family protein n=1 Tax=Planctomicrobium sp. SH664 TaxID=3448125 RepID=UPI003F5AE554
MSLTPLHVAVLLGGDSAEREISLQSAANVMASLRLAGHRVSPVDPSLIPLAQLNWTDVDVAFLALHGTHGEDGAVQRELEALQVCYTGSSALASERAFHKLAAKVMFLEENLPTPVYREIPAGAGAEQLQQLAGQIGYPLVIKPEAQGSSLGVTLVTEPSQLAAAAEAALQFDHRIFMERAIPGEEWTVSVLDDLVLPPIRISTPHSFFDFAAKYSDVQTRYDIMDDPQQTVTRRVRDLSLRAVKSLGCHGLCRVDLRVDPAGQPWLLEVNTIPGMTSHSLAPKAAASVGWSMSQLCEEMIVSALAQRSRLPGALPAARCA